MTMHLRHRAQSQREVGWQYCVTPDACAARPERQAAHGNITVVEVCRCGATRQSEHNQGLAHTSPWQQE